MTRSNHRIYIGFLSALVVFAFFAVVYYGLSYYKLAVEERVYDPGHSMFKPSGILGHAYGIMGSLMMIAGVLLYMARKRFRFMLRWGLLKHWLEFHIFLCTLGPLLVLFHTAFKFGGLVAISFWSMVAVFASGVIGRFIYLQIPRSIEGRELTLNEIRDMKGDVAEIIRTSYNLDEQSYNIIVESLKKKVGVYHNNAFVRYIRNRTEDRRSVRMVKKVLINNKLLRAEYKKVLKLVDDEITINRRIERLDTMQSLFKYWHVAHLPFAMVMLIVMVIHVAVTIVFGYRWIF
jgi:hypothetical protein